MNRFAKARRRWRRRFWQCRSSHSAGAQEAAPLRLTLDESIRRGLDTSHRHRRSRGARGRPPPSGGRTRRAAKLPQLAAQAGYTPHQSRRRVRHSATEQPAAL